MAASDIDVLELRRELRMEGVSFRQARLGEAFHVRLPAGNFCYCAMVRGGDLSFDIDYPRPRSFSLAEGDIVALSGMAPHALWRGPKSQHCDLLGQASLESAQPGAPVDLVIGVVKDEELALTTLRSGPTVIRPGEHPEAARRIWNAVGMLEDEYGDETSPHRNQVIRRLAEIIAINVARRIDRPDVSDNSEAETGILPALEAFLAAPTARWTLAKLSRIAGMSRTKFIQGFKQASGGEPPAKIMSRIRLKAAARSLVDKNLSLEVAAEQAGYGSAAAFSRAFQREFGETPARWRRRRRQPLGLT